MSAAAPTKVRYAFPAVRSPAYATEVKLIQIGRRALGLSDDEYRALLGGQTQGRTTSSTELTAQERQAVINRMKAMGFVIKPKNEPATGPGAVSLIRQAQMRKLCAIWYALAAVEAVGQPPTPAACREAVEAWALSRLPELESMRFVTGHQMNDLIEQAKAFAHRVGADLTAEHATSA